MLIVAATKALVSPKVADASPHRHRRVSFTDIGPAL
jgi:hypothetical protein